jgi:hypothetical protein
MGVPARTLILIAGALLAAVPLGAQRRFRIGPAATVIGLEDGTGASDAYRSWGGSLAALTGDDTELGLTVLRYGDLSNGACVRELTFFGLDSYYYPVGATGIAPFAVTQFGVARVRESSVPLLFACSATTPVDESTDIGYAFGLGVRVGTTDAAGLIEGRFLQIPNSFIQGLEGRATVSVAFGTPRTSQLLRGTLGPTASWLAPLGGVLAARGPLLGVRFRRDTRKAGVLGLHLDYAPLRIREGCTAACDATAILFAPTYEASLRPAWGRLNAGLGPLLAGFPSTGPDRGVAQGAHGGLGADIFGGRVMWNVAARLVWLQRATGDHVFSVQLGVGVSPPLAHAVSAEPAADGTP